MSNNDKNEPVKSPGSSHHQGDDFDGRGGPDHPIRTTTKPPTLINESSEEARTPAATEPEPADDKPS